MLQRSIAPRVYRVLLTISLALSLLWLLGGVFIATSAVQAQSTVTWYVAPPPVGDDANNCASMVTPCATVQHAIAVANDGDQIFIASGFYTESATLNKSISLAGADRDTTIIQASAGQRILTVTGATISTPVVISGLTFTGGSADYGGGIYVAGVPLYLSDVTMISNTASEMGGGLYSLDMFVDMTNTTFLSNSAPNGGGARFSQGGTIRNSRFIDNRTTGGWGGGLSAIGAITVANSDFISNTARGGGGLDVSGSVTVTDSYFLSNTGGGLVVAGPVNMLNTTFVGNVSLSYGGGAQIWGEAHVVASTFTGNAAGMYGGGAMFDSPSHIEHSVFTDNSADLEGGGAWFHHGAFITDTLFMHNTAPYGGGLSVDNAYSIMSATFAYNTAQSGGGICFWNYLSWPYTVASGDIVNTLLVANSATSGQGTALYAPGFTNVSTVTLRHVTIASPTIADGIAVVVSDAPFRLTNTIIASHTIAISNTGGVAYEDYNLFFENITNTVGVTNGGHSLSGDPQFVDPVNDNYHLGISSAAVDAGIDAGVTTDFDGDTRPQGAGFDIGYDEVWQPCGLSPNTDYAFGSPAAILSFSDLGDVSCVTVVYSPRAHPNATTAVGQDHFWQITARNSSGATATGFTAAITLPHSGFANPRICFYPGALGGSGWDCTGTQSFDGDEITRQGVTHFSDWAVGDNAGPTAIDLCSLEAAHSKRVSANPFGLGALLILSAVALVIVRGRRQSRQS